jgi:hypothetical protein
MKRSFVISLFFSLLAGCTHQLHGNDKIAKYRYLCTQYGYKVGTREFEKCMREHERQETKSNIQIDNYSPAEKRDNAKVQQLELPHRP